MEYCVNCICTASLDSNYFRDLGNGSFLVRPGVSSVTFRPILAFTHLGQLQPAGRRQRADEGCVAHEEGERALRHTFHQRRHATGHRRRRHRAELGQKLHPAYLRVHVLGFGTREQGSVKEQRFRIGVAVNLSNSSTVLGKWGQVKGIPEGTQPARNNSMPGLRQGHWGIIGQDLHPVQDRACSLQALLRVHSPEWGGNMAWGQKKEGQRGSERLAKARAKFHVRLDVQPGSGQSAAIGT